MNEIILDVENDSVCVRVVLVERCRKDECYKYGLEKKHGGHGVDTVCPVCGSRDYAITDAGKAILELIEFAK
ncbi:MAG: hypothetical protein KAS32_21980 [Candidatus Peribacteraceae bacterium]|nr:hypothetical protein [Candidatus Peribacteraceae bacterium]